MDVREKLVDERLELIDIISYATKWEAADHYKPDTNADRIRAMSDEELCKFLGECKFCDICEEGCNNCTYNGDCDKRLLEWLKQSEEGD